MTTSIYACCITILVLFAALRTVEQRVSAERHAFSFGEKT